MKYEVEVVNKDAVENPKSSNDIRRLKSWIMKHYPKSFCMPILPSETIKNWYIFKCMQLDGTKIYIKRNL